MATLEKRVEALEKISSPTTQKIILMVRTADGTLKPAFFGARPMRVGETEEEYCADALADYDTVIVLTGVKPRDDHAKA